MHIISRNWRSIRGMIKITKPQHVFAFRCSCFVGILKEAKHLAWQNGKTAIHSTCKVSNNNIYCFAVSKAKAKQKSKEKMSRPPSLDLAKLDTKDSLEVHLKLAQAIKFCLDWSTRAHTTHKGIEQNQLRLST